MPRSPASKLVQATIPALPHWPPVIGDPAVRNRGTIGGSVANNDPAADYPAGRARPRRHHRHRARARSRPTSSSSACSRPRLKPGEIIMAVRFPDAARGGLRQSSRAPASRYALVGVFVAKFGRWCSRRRNRSGTWRVPRAARWRRRCRRAFDPDAIAAIKIDADRSHLRHPCRCRLPRASRRR